MPRFRLTLLPSDRSFLSFLMRDERLNELLAAVNYLHLVLVIAELCNAMLQRIEATAMRSKVSHKSVAVGGRCVMRRSDQLGSDVVQVLSPMRPAIRHCNFIALRELIGEVNLFVELNEGLLQILVDSQYTEIGEPPHSGRYLKKSVR